MSSHLFKILRNNSLTRNLNFNTEDYKMVGKWKHIEKCYLLATSKEENLCPKLTDHYVIENKIWKMNMFCFMQVLSYQVGSLMKIIFLWNIEAEHKLDTYATNTAELILFLDKIQTSS